MLVSLIASRTVFQENIIVEYSSQLIVIRSGDLDLRYFRFLLRISGGHSTQCHNLSSG